jgi:hypothetical protein
LTDVFRGRKIPDEELQDRSAVPPGNPALVDSSARSLHVLSKEQIIFIHVDPNSKLAKVILVLGIPFWAIVLWPQLNELESSFRSRNWPVAKGTILKSKVEKHTDVHGIPHSTAKIEYDYVVNGKRFENTKVAFGLARGELTWGDADRKVAAWPKGKAAAVHYNPDQPTVSCLERGGIGWEDCVFALLAILGLVMGTNTATVALGRFWAARRATNPDFSMRAL